MAHHVFELLRAYLAGYGYWTIAAVLLLENAGIPLPGETVLLLASFLAYSEHKLHLPYIILVGVAAATLGDNLGFLFGFYGGRRLLERYGKTFHLAPRNLAHGENLFRRYGVATILLARFVAGMRIIAGPLAGVLRMPWRQFVICNFLGATLWGHRDRRRRLWVWQTLGRTRQPGARREYRAVGCGHRGDRDLMAAPGRSAQLEMHA